MERALGIVNFSAKHIWVEGLQTYRPIGAFSFLGRYRVIDFPISNMSNSGIDQIQVYSQRKPRSLVEHVGTGRQYNINSKRGNLQILFSEDSTENIIYNNDIRAFSQNLDDIEAANCSYVVIAPSYMVYSADFAELLQEHIRSGADISLLYHSTENAREQFLSCSILNMGQHRKVESINANSGTARNRSIFMDTYLMKKDLFMDLVKKGKKLSSMYTLCDVVNSQCSELDVRGIAHRGYFASITDFKSYYDANISLIDFKTASDLFKNDWPIYTRTNDSCPTQYFESASVKNSMVSNGCLIEGHLEHSVVGRGCVIQKGAVIRNCVLLPGVTVGKDAVLENQVVDKNVRIIHPVTISAQPQNPGYIRKNDII